MGGAKRLGCSRILDLDGEAAFAEATERLVGFGHRDIALINAPEHYMFAQHRAAGWRRGLAAAGLPDGPVLQAEATEENGHRLMSMLLARRRRPTAVLCATDRMAVGALHALASAGLRAGRDVSVIGYDDLPMASYTDPPLTTLEQPIPRMAQRLVDMLLALLDGADPALFARGMASATDCSAVRRAGTTNDAARGEAARVGRKPCRRRWRRCAA